jgi:hypothetical protein
MKKVIFVLVLLSSIHLNAQIVEEYSYSSIGGSINPMVLVSLEDAGEKWMHRIMLPATNSGPYCDQWQMIASFSSAPACQATVCAIEPFCCNSSWDSVCAALAVNTPECAACLSTAPGNTSTRKIQLLNLDYTLFVEIDCSLFPNATPTHPHFSALYFSQYLFDDDDGVEFLFSYTGSPYPSYTGVYNTDGSLLAAFPGSSVNNGLASVYQHDPSPIKNTANGAIMQLIYPGEIKFYSLPGTLYDPCCNSDNPGIPTHNPSVLPVRGMSNAFPNPTYGAVTIDYELPAGITSADLLIVNSAGQTVKSYKISSVINRVNLDLSNLAPGNYFYQIETNSGPAGAKKLIKL